MRNNDRSLEINTELTRVLDECRQNGVRFEPGMTADELRRALEKVSVETLTPIEAMNTLARLQEMAKQESGE